MTSAPTPDSPNASDPDDHDALMDRYFCTEALSGTIKGDTVRGGASTMASQLSKVVLNAVSLVILARLLNPSDVGLVGMVAVLSGFVLQLRDLGLSMVTVQQANINHRQVSTLFWIMNAVGLGLALMVALCAFPFAWFYNEPRLLAITFVQSIGVPLSVLGAQHQAILRRQMRFAVLSSIELLSFVVSLIVTIALAYFGSIYWPDSNYWSIALMPLVNSGVATLGYWYVCKWRPGLPTRNTGVRPMIKFGANLTGSNLIIYLTNNIDTAMVGWRWKEVLTGYYVNAYKLLVYPFLQILGPISAVAIPALSRLKDDPVRYRSFFRQGTRLGGSLQIPISVFAFVASYEVVMVVLGAKWEAVIPIFRAFFPASLMIVTAPTTYWIFVSRGHSGRMLVMSIATFFVSIIAYGIALPHGPIGVALAFSLSNCAMRVPTILYAIQGTPLTWRDVVEPLYRPLACSAFAGIGVWILGIVFPYDKILLLRLIGQTFTFAILYLASMFLTPGGKELLQSWAGLIVHFKGKPSE